MPKLELKKLQKHQLGKVLADAGFDPKAEFELETPGKKDPTAILKHVESNETFEIVYYLREDTGRSDSFYNTIYRLASSNDEPESRYAASWGEILLQASSWADALYSEVSAEDPWSDSETESVEDIESSDEMFTPKELPQIDRGIDAVLADLSSKAMAGGGDVEAIRVSVGQIEKTLKAAARNASKREWLVVFKTIIATELSKWGLESNLIGSLVHTLIAASQDISQLAEHASKLSF